MVRHQNATVIATVTMRAVWAHVWPAQESPEGRPGSRLVRDILGICFVSLGDKLLSGLLGKFGVI